MEEKILGIVALFDDQTNEKINKLYAILKQEGFIGTQTKDIPYHFTIGIYQPYQETMLIDLLEKVGKKATSIDFRFDHVGLFGLKVLFIEPNMNYELLDLQKNFFEEYTKGYHMWAVHTTILIDEENAITKALPIVANHFKPMHAKIEKLALYEFFPTRLIKMIDLQSR